MDYTYTPLIWLYAGTVLVNLIMILYLLRNRRMPGAAAFIFTLLLSTLWCVGTVMEITAVQLDTKLFWTKVGYPAYAFSPIAWMVMVLQVTDRWNTLQRRSRILLFVIPVVTVLLVWTNELHGLMWNDAYTVPAANVQVLVLTRKLVSWFRVHVLYSDSLNILSLFLIARFIRKNAPLHRRQYRCLVYSMLFVVIVNALYTLRIWPSFDVTPVAWGLSALFIAWAMFRNKLFELIPIAHNRVMESLTDAAVVIDLKNRIVDMNPSAGFLFACDAAEEFGCGAGEFFEGWPVLQQAVGQEIAYSPQKVCIIFLNLCLRYDWRRLGYPLLLS